MLCSFTQELSDRAHQLQAALAASRAQAMPSEAQQLASDARAACGAAAGSAAAEPATGSYAVFSSRQPAAPDAAHLRPTAQQPASQRNGSSAAAKRRPRQLPTRPPQPDLLHELLAVAPTSHVANAAKRDAPSAQQPGRGPQPGGSCSSGSGRSSNSSNSSAGSSVHDSAASDLLSRSNAADSAQQFAEDVLLREVVSRLKGPQAAATTHVFPASRLQQPSDGPSALPKAGRLPHPKPYKSAAAMSAEAATRGAASVAAPAAAVQLQQAAGASAVQVMMRSIILEATAAATAAASAEPPGAGGHSASSAAGGGFFCRVRLPGASSGDLPCSRLPVACSGSSAAAAAADLRLTSGSCVLPLAGGQLPPAAVVEVWRGAIGSGSGGAGSGCGGGASGAALVGLAAVSLAGGPVAANGAATGSAAALADGCFQLRDVLTGRQVGSISVAVTAVSAANGNTAAGPAAAAAAAGAAPRQQQAAAGGVLDAGHAPAACGSTGTASGGEACTSETAGGAAKPAARHSSGSAAAAAADSAEPPAADHTLVLHRAHGLSAAAEGGAVVHLRGRSRNTCRKH